MQAKDRKLQEATSVRITEASATRVVAEAKFAEELASLGNCLSERVDSAF